MRTLVATALILVTCAPAGFAQDTKIHDAVKAADLPAVQALLEAQPTLVSAKNSDGQTPLHIATKNGHRKIVELLLEKHAEVNANDKFEGTPLHWAVLYGRREVVELLLAKGAAANATERKGWTPLHYAAWKDHKDLAELLISNGADVHAQQAEGMTPLHIAALNGGNEVAVLLVAKGAAIEARDKQGNTPLRCAIAKNQVNTSILLYRYECLKSEPGLAAASRNIEGRYKWTRSKYGTEYKQGRNTDVTVTEIIRDGKHQHRVEGHIVASGWTSSADTIMSGPVGGVEIDIPGCRVRIRVDPRVGVTNYAGFAFKTPCTLRIGDDCTLLADEEWIVAQDEHNTYWVSRPVIWDGKNSMLFFSAKSSGSPRQNHEVAQLGRSTISKLSTKDSLSSEPGQVEAKCELLQTDLFGLGHKFIKIGNSPPGVVALELLNQGRTAIAVGGDMYLWVKAGQGTGPVVVLLNDESLTTTDRHAFHYATLADYYTSLEKDGTLNLGFTAWGSLLNLGKSYTDMYKGTWPATIGPHESATIQQQLTTSLGADEVWFATPALSSQEVRSSGYRILARLGRSTSHGEPIVLPMAPDTLTSFIGDREKPEMLRRWAVGWLAQLPNGEGAQHVVRLLRADDQPIEVRKTAARWLATQLPGNGLAPINDVMWDSRSPAELQEACYYALDWSLVREVHKPHRTQALTLIAQAVKHPNQKISEEARKKAAEKDY